MYNSIQHFNEFGIKKIEKAIDIFIAEKKDIADLVIDLQEKLFELGRDIVAEVLEDMDEYIFNSEGRKREYESVRKDHASLLTSFGMIEYNRRYYKSKSTRTWWMNMWASSHTTD